MEVMLTADEFDCLREEFRNLSLGEKGGEVRSDYTPPSAWAQECLAYIGEELTLFAFDLARLLTERDGDNPDRADNVRQKLVEIGAPRSVGTSHGTIHYWPGITVATDLAEV